MDQGNDKKGVQELDSKGLIDTVEEIKNGGPGSLYKDLSPQLQRINLSIARKTRTKQNPNPNVAKDESSCAWLITNGAVV